MRGVWGSAALVLPLLTCGSAAAEPPQGARVAMPFTCAVERGRVRVQSGPEQVYEIVDRTDSHPFTACPPGATRQCRTFTVHRFTLSCPGGRAPWVEVAAAAAASRPDLLPRVELEDGRLLLGRRAPGAGLVRDCYARLAGAGPRVRIYDPVVQDECWNLNRRSGASRIELPLGYAPLMLARARLLPASKPVPAPVAHVPVAHALPVPAPVAAAAPQIERETLREGPPSPAARFAAPASSWRTEVTSGSAATEAAPPAAIALPPRQPEAPSPDPLWMLAAAAALVGLPLLAWVAVWRKPANGQASAAPGTAARRADAQAVDGLKAIGLDLIPRIRDRLDHLPAAMPLRQVLARELHTAAQRFATLAAEEPAGAEAERRNRSRLQANVRDLQRLSEITAGAQSSLGGSALMPAELPEPRDKAEAYALLGVNPDVSEHIAKKLVEALRQSWHPDHARDDADRSRREHRIKQINVAWDLIQGKRVEA